MRFAVAFSHDHAAFREPELQSISELLNLDIRYNPLRLLEDEFVEMHASLEDLQGYMSRSVLARICIELWAMEATFEAAVLSLKEHPESFFSEVFTSDPKTFKICIETFGKKLIQKDRLALIEPVASLFRQGEIDLGNPCITLYIFQFFGLDSLNNPLAQSKTTFIGKYACQGRRELISFFNLRERSMVGNTSMDPELSLIMSNFALARPGSLIYDPFMGTASMLYTCAGFGSYVCGSDISFITVHGLGKTPRAKVQSKIRTARENIRSTFEQYNLSNKLIDLFVADNAHIALRHFPLFDAIVTDPPYGIREGARKLTKDELMAEEHRGKHFPKSENYEISTMFAALLSFAANYLVMNGRLVFWIPVIREEYNPSMVPQHPCFELLSNCEQILAGKLGRRLITLRKIQEPNDDSIATSSVPSVRKVLMG